MQVQVNATCWRPKGEAGRKPASIFPCTDGLSYRASGTRAIGSDLPEANFPNRETCQPLPPPVRPLAFSPALLEPLMELALLPPAAALPPVGSTGPRD
jgi:hypothetical protein